MNMEHAVAEIRMTTRHRRPGIGWTELRARYGRGLPWSIAGIVIGSMLFGYQLGLGERPVPAPPAPPQRVIFLQARPPSPHTTQVPRWAHGLRSKCPTEDSCKLDYRKDGWHVIPIVP